MKNLATRVDNLEALSEVEKTRVDEVCKTVREELTLAGIQILNLKGPQFKFTEVPYDCFGVLGISEKDLAETNRMSEYWKSDMWDHFSELGTFSFTFCRAWYYWIAVGAVPHRVAQEMYDNELGRKDVRVAGYAGNTPPEGWTKDIGGKKFVTSYHIDSQEGLNYFVQTVTKHGLVKGSLAPRSPADYADFGEFCSFMHQQMGSTVAITTSGEFPYPKHLQYWNLWRHARDTA